MSRRKILCWVTVLCILVTGLSFSVTAQENTESVEVPGETQFTTIETTQPETTEATQPETTQPDIVPGGSCGEKTMWRFEESTGTLTIYGTGDMDDYSGKSNPWESYRQSVKNLVIESGVTGIGAYSFRYTSGIRSVKLPSSVKRIGDSAFSNCTGLQSFTMSDGVTELGINAFDNCYNLQKITLSNKLTEIPFWTFYGCNALSSLTVPASVKKIGKGICEQSTGFSSIIFQGSAPVIDAEAFKGLTISATYPSDDSSWAADKLKNYGGKVSWIPAGGNAVIGGEFGRSATMQWKLEGSTLTITGNGYMDWESGNYPPWYAYRGQITKAVLSGNIQDLYTNCFAGCAHLTEIIWPSGITVVFNNAFLQCTSLTSIKLPDSVESLEDCAFKNCTALKEVTLSKELKDLSNSCFSGCTALKTLTLPTKTNWLGSTVFHDSGLKTLYFTGDMPRLAGDRANRLLCTFDGVTGLTVYYPAGNSSWTAKKVQELEAFYDNGEIVLKATSSPGAQDAVGTVPSTGTGGTQDVAKTEPPTNTGTVNISQQAQGTTETTEVVTETDITQTTQASMEAVPDQESTSETVQTDIPGADSENGGNAGTVVTIVIAALVLLAGGIAFWYFKGRKNK